MIIIMKLLKPFLKEYFSVLIKKFNSKLLLFSTLFAKQYN